MVLETLIWGLLQVVISPVGDSEKPKSLQQNKRSAPRKKTIKRLQNRIFQNKMRKWLNYNLYESHKYCCIPSSKLLAVSTQRNDGDE